MRALSQAEYRTLLAILSSPGASERERIRRSGLPSSTYNVVRRRAYSDGWISDVLVPSPIAFGWSDVEVRLARPPLAMAESSARAWANEPGCVHLWSGLQSVFGVFFLPDVGTGSTDRDAPADQQTGWRVRVRREAGSLPVYFDYSGLWARFGGQPPPKEYPLGLPASEPSTDRRALAAAVRLLRSDGAASADRPGWTNLWRFPKAPRAALTEGLLSRRGVLDLARLPPFDGRRLSEVVLIGGRLRAGATGNGLLNALRNDCAVFPFLLSEADGALVLAGVGQSDSERAGRVPVPAARGSVLSTVTAHLDDAEISLEPVEAIRERVVHRYGAALPVRGPSPGR
ncbi:MAG TPA: hypothetical protein VGV64_04355 [Thermoplasmata archaeon]|nr:hypothetical protein [Thermoplasmata archaeon]